MPISGGNSLPVWRSGPWRGRGRGGMQGWIGESRQTFVIAGLSRDSTGAVLGNCIADLFDLSNAFLARTTSDAAGFYVFRMLGKPPSNYFVRCYKSGAPDVFGTTANGLLSTTEVILQFGSAWVVPAGLTTLTSVECWGQGGGGAVAGSTQRGAGAAYARITDYGVTAGASIPIQVSSTSTLGSDGVDTWFNDAATVMAKGGGGATSGGSPGLAALSVGTVKFSGSVRGASGSPFGDGAPQAKPTAPWGDDAANAGIGGDGSNSVGSIEDGVSHVDGGGGGANSHSGNGSTGGNGGLPGGGGGAGETGTPTDGGLGGAGQIRITYSQ